MDSKLIDPHHPVSTKDIIGNSEIWQLISTKIKARICPHLIICGPAGVGKTTFVRTMLLSSGYTVFTHNCIADSGLRDVRDSIRSFARGNLDTNKNHRWVVLEHADSLTADTQAFLRRLLETASASTRFIFEVRESGAISEPILSRSWLCNIDTPSFLEIRYEILRRTTNHISIEDAERIATDSCGNVRVAVHNALAILHLNTQKNNIGCGSEIIESLWQKRPDTKDTNYGLWACETIKAIKNSGLDSRVFLRLKMRDNNHALRVLSQWNRPGGSSSRALWLYAMCGQIE